MYVNVGSCLYTIHVQPCTHPDTCVFAYLFVCALSLSCKYRGKIFVDTNTNTFWQVISPRGSPSARGCFQGMSICTYAFMLFIYMLYINTHTYIHTYTYIPKWMCDVYDCKLRLYALGVHTHICILIGFLATYEVNKMCAIFMCLYEYLCADFSCVHNYECIRL
jgi:hypothetical protein